MPGSVTIGHLEATATLDHSDAHRLAELLDELGHLMAVAGPNRLTDAQLGALRAGQEPGREELARFCRGVAARLHDQLHEKPHGGM
ncbi:hypothetical protein ACIGXM_19730 [Kitasatospora sp. NPDC052896]|uniref:hypothetical protein n=1 Tax=Kitasatospora sp. NPDC052896 TaxID=3364061 RepID=UPI0037C59726